MLRSTHSNSSSSCIYSADLVRYYVFDVIFYMLKRKTNTYRTMSRQHKSRCLHLLKLYVIQCYAPVITLTSSARLRYIIKHVSTISRSQMHYLHKVCHEYTSIHSDIIIIVFVCLHITYCNFLSCNKARHFSHVKHLCMMHVQMRHMSLHAHFPLPVNLSASYHTMSEKPPAKRGRGRSAIRHQSRSQKHTASNIVLLRSHRIKAYATTASILLIKPPVHPSYRSR